MKEKEKQPYFKKFEDEKIKFEADCQMVSHYLFRDFNDVIMRKPSAFRIFLMKRMEQGFENGENSKEINKKASYDWKIMPPEEKKQYLALKRKSDNWFAKVNKFKKVTALAMFVQKVFSEAKKKNTEVPNNKDIVAAWRKLSDNAKIKYEKFAEEVNKERKELNEIYELVHGIKPRRPIGAFATFLQEKAKNGELKTLTDGREMWEKLSEEEKEYYVVKNRRTELAYKYKKMIYEKRIKKIRPKNPTTVFGCFLQEKKGAGISRRRKFFNIF